jgi:hypothetical protein
VRISGCDVKQADEERFSKTPKTQETIQGVELKRGLVIVIVP